MKLTAIRAATENFKTGALLIPFFKKETKLSSSLKALDGKLGGAVSQAIQAGFDGAEPKYCAISGRKGVAADRIVLWSLGEKDKATTDKLRQAAYDAANELAKQKIKDIAIDAGRIDISGVDADVAARALADGLLYHAYDYAGYEKDREKPKKIEKAALLYDKSGDANDAAEACVAAAVVMSGVNFARDLGNTPSNYMTATAVGNAARAMARKHRLACKVFDKAQLQAKGFGGILGVNRGSTEPPRFIVLEYRPRGASGKTPTIVFVGKGLTFDTGGVSQKPAAGMESMKYDMAGGAAVIGAMQAVAQLKPKARVIGLVSATDNKDGSHAINPGDVLVHYGGKTTEVINTDAEGRLVLADALEYAKQYEPDAVVDMATLTGACVVALGDHIAGLMANNDDVAEQILAASKRTDEHFWKLPLHPEYKKRLESDCANQKNVTSGGGAGTITAGLFLSAFVDNAYPWAHLDIAGPAMHDGPKWYYNSRGTGFPVRTLIEFVQQFKKPGKNR